MKIEDKIALCAIKHHPESHIRLDQATCKRCTERLCVRACPGQLYEVDPDTNEVRVEHTGCLECGTCLVVCPHGAVTWSYPQPGHGIRYRHG